MKADEHHRPDQHLEPFDPPNESFPNLPDKTQPPLLIPSIKTPLPVMKCTTFFVVAAAIALTSVHAAVDPSPNHYPTSPEMVGVATLSTVELRRLQIGSIDFKDESRAASLNGIKAGEEILAAVNKLEPTLFVNGDQLLTLAIKMAASETIALATADAKTKKIGAALKKAIEQLFAGQTFVDVLKKVLPTIPAAK